MNFRRRKKPSVNYVNPYSVLKLWQYSFFLLLFIFEVKDTFRNVDFTIPHNVSNHFHSASVWIRLKQQQHCVLSQHWKNNDNNNKKSPKMPATSLSVCLQLSSSSRYNPVAISESKCIQIKVVYGKSLRHLLVLSCNSTRHRFCWRCWTVFSPTSDEVVFYKFTESALAWSYSISFCK